MEKKRYTCGEYREEMLLLGLKKRMADPELSEEEKQNLIVEICRLEKKMGMEWYEWKTKSEKL